MTIIRLICFIIILFIVSCDQVSTSITDEIIVEDAELTNYWKWTNFQIGDDSLTYDDYDIQEQIILFTNSGDLYYYDKRSETTNKSTYTYEKVADTLKYFTSSSSHKQRYRIKGDSLILDYMMVGLYYRNRYIRYSEEFPPSDWPDTTRGK